MSKSSMFKRSLVILSLALPLSCGGGGGSTEDSSANRGSNNDKTLSVEVAVRTLRELGASSAVTARSPILNQLDLNSLGSCPRAVFEPGDTGFSYALDFGDGCGPAGLPFNVSGSIGGSISAGTRSIEVTSFYDNFSAGLGTIEGRSDGIYTLLGAGDFEQFGFAADVSIDQSLTAAGLSLRVRGDLEERLTLNLSASSPALQVAIDTASLAVTINGDREFAVSANGVVITAENGMLPASGSITVVDSFSSPPNTVTITFDGQTPFSGLVDVTEAQSGITELFDLNELGLH